MFAYWLLFILWALGAIQFSRRGSYALDKPFFLAMAAFTAIMIGLRFQVGGDWYPYIRIYNDVAFQPLAKVANITDFGYAFFNWLGAKFDSGVWVPNLACGVFFMIGVARLAQRQPNPWLAALVAIPYLTIVVAMGYTRQAAAIGFICWALADASERNIVRQIVLIGIAALFHKTAILFLPILLVPLITRNFLGGIVASIAFVIMFSAFLSGTSDNLVTSYAMSSYDSQGAAIRVAMNVLAGVLLLMFRQRMGFTDYIAKVWTMCAILSLISPVGLLLLSASSGVDRLSLFLIPLQFVTLSRLPYALSDTERPLPSLLIGVILYSTAIQFVWLNFADNAWAWLPYRTIFSSDAWYNG